VKKLKSKSEQNTDTLETHTYISKEKDIGFRSQINQQNSNFVKIWEEHIITCLSVKQKCLKQQLPARWEMFYFRI
jgi:hypothetical protein